MTVKKLFILFFLILLATILILLATSVLASGDWVREKQTFLSDLVIDSDFNITPFNLIANNLVVLGNASILGQIFNVTVNNVEYNITSMSVVGNVNITGESFDVNVSRMKIYNDIQFNNKVGINVSTPTHELNVKGDVNITGNILSDNGFNTCHGDGWTTVGYLGC